MVASRMGFWPGAAFLGEAWVSVQLVWRLIIMNFMKRSVDVISYMYVGRLGEVYLSAAGLANVTANVTGNSILMGLGGALSTLCSQAYGAKDVELTNEILQRAVLILLSVCVPLSISWLYSAEIMRTLGQNEEIATLASSYLMRLIPGLFARAYSMCLEGWLTSQQKTTPPAVISIVAATLHPLWCYLFIFRFNFAFLGSAMAISFTRFLEAVLFTSYAAVLTSRGGSHFRFTRRAFSDWGPYLRLGLPNVLMTSQWWAEEIIIFMSGLLPNPSRQLAAMSVYQYVIGICYVTVKSVGAVSSARVGFCLGLGDAALAETAARVAFVLALSVACLQSLLLLIWRNQIGYIFTNERGVVSLFGSTLVFVLVPYVIADGVQGGLSGVLNGMGRQALAGPVCFICYYLIGIPVAVIASGLWNLGIELHVLGLTIGVAVATWAHALVYSYIVSTTAWQLQVDRAQGRLSKISALTSNLEQGIVHHLAEEIRSKESIRHTSAHSIEMANTNSVVLENVPVAEQTVGSNEDISESDLAPLLS